MRVGSSRIECAERECQNGERERVYSGRPPERSFSEGGRASEA